MPIARELPIYRDEVPGAPIRDEDRPFQDGPVDDMPTPEEAKNSMDGYIYFFTHLFQGIADLFPSVSYDVNPPSCT